uniref:Shugoshin C-terminal domain-containing protein n=1 Tax=Panagrolaimus superbus TaxID=310955 RepID=A0A914YE51_9BILA
MPEDNNKYEDVHKRLDKMCETQQIITNYLQSLNQFIMYSNFNVTQQFSDIFSALQFGSSLMNEQLESIKSEDPKANSDTEKHNKKENSLNELEVTDIFSKFPHSALITPPSFSGSLNNRKGMHECSPVSSTSSLTELYENIAKAPGSKAFNRNFSTVLKSPNVSIVKEVSNTSVLDKSSAPSCQLSNISSVTTRKQKIKMPRPLTPVPADESARSRRTAAPVSLKEPSLKKKMRRT